MLSHQGRTTKDKDEIMSANHKIQKTTGGVIHSGSWAGNEEDPKTSKYGYFTPSCGSGVVYAMGSLRNIAGFREAKADAKVTCKKCLKLIAKTEEEARAEAAEKARKDEAKAALSAEPKPETSSVYDHEAAVAQMRANREAEEEERAAARRARNRTNYAPAPAPAVHEAEPEPQEETPSVDDMRAEYEDLILIARGLRLLADELCRKLAEMQNSGMEKDHPRFQKTHAKLVRCLDLESANLKTRVALSEKIRETRIRNAYDREKPFHRQVKDAINLKW